MSQSEFTQVPIGHWFDQLATVFRGTANCDRAEDLVRLLQTVVNFDYCVIFAYNGANAPIGMFDTFSAEQRRAFVTDYQAGPYHLDPFYKASFDGIAPGLYGIRELAPDHFFLSEYFLSYYRKMGLADEIGYFVDAGNGIRIVMSLMRASGQERFSKEEQLTLQTFDLTVQSFVANLWQDSFSQSHSQSQQEPESDDSDINRRLEKCFVNFGSDVLTQREQQIAQMLLRGHSSASISNELFISPGTVKIHRKNIYAKLGISAHSELFSQFLASLAGIENLQTE